MQLDGGSGGRQVQVQRAQPVLVHIDESSIVLVRGYVNDDLSISEVAGYAPTVLSDNFGECFALHSNFLTETNRVNYRSSAFE